MDSACTVDVLKWKLVCAVFVWMQLHIIIHVDYFTTFNVMNQICYSL